MDQSIIDVLADPVVVIALLGASLHLLLTFGILSRVAGVAEETRRARQVRDARAGLRGKPPVSEGGERS